MGTEVVNFLLKNKKVDPSADDNEAIGCALEEVIYQLLNYYCKTKKVNPYADNNYAFRLACANKHYGIIKLLINFQMDNSSVVNSIVDNCKVA